MSLIMDAIKLSFTDEHDKGILAFYEKNGFIPNSELYNKNRATICIILRDFLRFSP